MGEKASIRAAAAVLGCSHTALRKAIECGRMSKSVVRDQAGGPPRLDLEVAPAEWHSIQSRVRPTRNVARPQSAPCAAEAEVTAQLVAIVAGDFTAVQRLAVELVPHLVAGVAADLRSRGVEPSVEALSRALGLDPRDEDSGLGVTLVLQEILDDGPAAGAEAAARAAGVEMAGEHRKGNGHGD